MHSTTLHQRTTTPFLPSAILFIPVLLLSLAAFNSPVLGQQASFLVNHPLNPLKSLAVASKTESHPFFVDIDGDGDLDCFSGEYTNGTLSRVYFYRNEGNRRNPAFKAVSGAANPLEGVLTNTLSIPYFIDMDGDGDYDCFIGEGNTGALLYYKNTGTATHPLFEKQSAAFNPLSMVKFSASGVASPAFADVDGDGDYDCVIADQSGNLSYFRNVGSATRPRFQHVANSSADNPFAALARSGGIYNLSFADWNKDGLPDLFIGTIYYRNTGTKQSAQFTRSSGVAVAGQQQTAAPEVQSTTATTARYTYTPLRWVDLDGDGTPEVFQGSAKGDFVFETLANSKAVAAVVTTFNLSPNPSKSAFTVRLPTAAEGTTSTIRITDVQGKVLSTQTTTNSSLKVGATLQPGVYVLQVLQNNQVVYKQKIVKE